MVLRLQYNGPVHYLGFGYRACDISEKQKIKERECLARMPSNRTLTNEPGPLR